MPSPTDLPLVLRPATSADIPLLERWDEDPDVIGATSDDGTPDIGFGAYWEEEIARQSGCRRGVGGNRRVALSPADLNAKTGG
jgi:hypothetical protein